MRVTYPAIFHPEDPGYWVEFPDLPGCVSSGDSFEEALRGASESLGLYLEGAPESGEKLPLPSNPMTMLSGSDPVVIVTGETVPPSQASEAQTA